MNTGTATPTLARDHHETLGSITIILCYQSYIAEEARSSEIAQIRAGWY